MLWLRNTDYQKTYETQEKLAIVAFFAELPNLLATVVAIFLTRSGIVLVDLLSSFGSTLHNAVVALLSRHLKKENGEKFHYGVEKIEAMASISCNVLMITGFCCVLFYAIYSCIVVAAPSDKLYVFILIKSFNILFDVWFLVQNKRNAKLRSNAVSETEIATYKAYLLDDLIVFFATVISFLFRDISWIVYFAPVFSFVNALYAISSCIKNIKTNIKDIIDLAPSVEFQDRVADILFEHRKSFRSISFINFKKSSKKVLIELGLVFPDDTTFAQQMHLMDTLSSEIIERVGDCEVLLRPCKPD